MELDRLLSPLNVRVDQKRKDIVDLLGNKEVLGIAYDLSLIHIF